MSHAFVLGALGLWLFACLVFAMAFVPGFELLVIFAGLGVFASRRGWVLVNVSPQGYEAELAFLRWEDEFRA